MEEVLEEAEAKVWGRFSLPSVDFHRLEVDFLPLTQDLLHSDQWVTGPHFILFHVIWWQWDGQLQIHINLH
jgi:hypothetical protein